MILGEKIYLGSTEVSKVYLGGNEIWPSEDEFDLSDIDGLKYWAKPQDLSLSDNDPVSSHTDFSGLNNHATNSGSARPTFKTNIQNGLPVLRFDGSDDFLEIADTSIIGGGQTGMTIFTVIKQNSPLALNVAFLAKWDYQTQGCFACQSDASAPDELRMFVANAVNDAGGNNILTTNANLVANTFYLVTIVYDGTQSAANRVKFYINGGSATTGMNGTVPASLISCTATLKLGSFGGVLPRNWPGDMGETAIYDSALSDVNREAARDKINSRWATY